MLGLAGVVSVGVASVGGVSVEDVSVVGFVIVSGSGSVFVGGITIVSGIVSVAGASQLNLRVNIGIAATASIVPCFVPSGPNHHESACPSASIHAVQQNNSSINGVPSDNFPVWNHSN